MNDKQQLKKIEEFIQAHTLAVLATADTQGLPQAAVVGFAEKEFDLIFGTFESSKKYSNLKRNPNVAVVIGWEKGVTVQYEGVAEELQGQELEECKRIHLAKIPSAAKYVSEKEEKFFKVKPKLIRFSDLSADPWDIFEIRF